MPPIMLNEQVVLQGKTKRLKNHSPIARKIPLSLIKIYQNIESQNMGQLTVLKPFAYKVTVYYTIHINKLYTGKTKKHEKVASDKPEPCIKMYSLNHYCTWIRFPNDNYVGVPFYAFHGKGEEKSLTLTLSGDRQEIQFSMYRNKHICNKHIKQKSE